MTRRQAVLTYGSQTDIRLWLHTEADELEFRRPLPPNSFYKVVQRNIERNAVLRHKALTGEVIK